MSSYAEKAFDKRYHFFMIKALNKQGLEGMHLNIIRLYMKNLRPTLY
jgi:hypothetical protein